MSDTPPNEFVKVAIVGMTGSGKTVLISTLATKMAQMALDNIFLAPVGDNRRQTLRYSQSNWQILNEGRWPASTPAGELIELQWELTTKNHQAQVQFLDCAGQDVRSLFRTDNFNPSKLRGDLRRVYDSISSANILIFLVNMKDLLATPDYVEELMDLDQMFHTLNQRKDIPRKMAVVFSQYDKYKPEVDQKFNGDFLEYLRHYIPLLHGQYIRKRNFEIIPVGGVNDTQSVIENGEVKQYPVPDFSSYNLETLIHWIADSVEALAPEVQEYWRKQSLYPANPVPANSAPANPAPVKPVPAKPVPANSAPVKTSSYKTTAYNTGSSSQASRTNSGFSVSKLIGNIFILIFALIFETVILGGLFSIIGLIISLFLWGFSGCLSGAYVGFLIGFVLSLLIILFGSNNMNNHKK